MDFLTEISTTRGLPSLEIRIIQDNAKIVRSTCSATVSSLSRRQRERFNNSLMNNSSSDMASKMHNLKHQTARWSFSESGSPMERKISLTKDIDSLLLTATLNETLALRDRLDGTPMGPSFSDPTLNNMIPKPQRRPSPSHVSGGNFNASWDQFPTIYPNDSSSIERTLAHDEELSMPSLSSNKLPPSPPPSPVPDSPSESSSPSPSSPPPSPANTKDCQIRSGNNALPSSSMSNPLCVRRRMAMVPGTRSSPSIQKHVVRPHCLIAPSMMNTAARPPIVPIDTKDDVRVRTFDFSKISIPASRIPPSPMKPSPRNKHMNSKFGHQTKTGRTTSGGNASIAMNPKVQKLCMVAPSLHPDLISKERKVLDKRPLLPQEERHSARNLFQPKRDSANKCVDYVTTGKTNSDSRIPLCPQTEKEETLTWPVVSQSPFLPIHEDDLHPRKDITNC